MIKFFHNKIILVIKTEVFPPAIKVNVEHRRRVSPLEKANLLFKYKHLIRIKSVFLSQMIIFLSLRICLW